MTPYYQDDWLTVFHGDCREVMAGMEPESVHCVVTSPAYWGLRDYGTATWVGGDAECAHAPQNGSGRPGRETPGGRGGSFPHDATPYHQICRACGAIRQDAQLGLERTPDEYVANLVAVFREVRRVLRKDGTVWLNLGDSYVGANNTDIGGNANFGSAAGVSKASNGSKAAWIGLPSKNLVGIPWRVAFALQADGWYLRSEIIWAKPNPMPESVTDRPTKAHETIFLLSKSPRYYFDQEAVREGLYSVPRDAAAISVSRSPEPPGRVVAMPAMLGGTDDGLESTTGIYREGPGSQPTLRQERQGQSDEAQAGYVGPQASAGSGLSDHARGQGGQSSGQHESLWASSPGSVLRSSPDGNGATVHADGGTVVSDPGDAIGDVRVLRADDEVDDGPRYPAEQGWSSHDGERGGSLQALQQSEARSAGGRNLRSVWTMATQPYPGAHFATFPPKLVEPCIKAGTSEKGVCPECGAPWERVVDRGSPRPVVEPSELDRYGTGEAGVHRKVGGQYQKWLDANPSETTGWRASCTHAAEPVPAVVLDCFAGSGTTGMVAQSLSRRAVLIDLSLDYLGQLMARNAEIPLGLTS